MVKGVGLESTNESRMFLACARLGLVQSRAAPDRSVVVMADELVDILLGVLWGC